MIRQILFVGIVGWTELEAEELERKVTRSDSVIAEEARHVETLSDHVGEYVRNVLLEMGAEGQAHSRDEEELPLLWKLQKS